MRLVERLAAWDGRDVALLEEVYDLHAGLGDFVAQALEAAAGDERGQSGGTWMLKRRLEEGGRLDAQETARFFGLLGALTAWEAQLHALQSMPYLTISARSRPGVERFVRAALESEATFVRAWAYTGLFELASTFDELRAEADRLMDAGLEEGPASVRARIRNLRKKGWGSD